MTKPLNRPFIRNRPPVSGDATAPPKSGVRSVFFKGVVVLIAFVVTGCLDVETINFTLSLDAENLYSGTATVEFVKIRSTETDPAKRKREMDDLFSGYRNEAKKILESIPLFDERVELRNKTASSTDAVITGKFKNVLAMFGILTEGEFRFEGERKRLSVYWKNPLTDETDTNLIVRFPGNIVSHNSKHFDSATGTMRWNLGKHGDREIRFVLEGK